MAHALDIETVRETSEAAQQRRAEVSAALPGKKELEARLYAERFGERNFELALESVAEAAREGKTRIVIRKKLSYDHPHLAAALVVDATERFHQAGYAAEYRIVEPRPTEEDWPNDVAVLTVDWSGDARDLGTKPADSVQHRVKGSLRKIWPDSPERPEPSAPDPELPTERNPRSSDALTAAELRPGMDIVIGEGHGGGIIYENISAPYRDERGSWVIDHYNPYYDIGWRTTSLEVIGIIPRSDGSWSTEVSLEHHRSDCWGNDSSDCRWQAGD